MTYRLFFTIVISLFGSGLAFSQDWNRYWCFGDSAALDFSNANAPIPSFSYMDCSSSCASVGDSANGLLMYTHHDYWPLWLQGNVRTTVVHNKFHSIMENGEELIGSAFHDGLVFLPKPGNDSVFYLFQYGFTPDSGLFYSVIEPYYNGDSGRVTLKNIPLTLTHHLLQWSILTCRHANGRDWWIIVKNGYLSNVFSKFLLTTDSIYGPFEQNIGIITHQDAASLAISMDGEKIAVVNFAGEVETFSFDRCSGIISNPKTVFINPVMRFFGCEFSPSGNLLYVANSNNIFGDSLCLFQFDLNDTSSASLKIIYKQDVPASGGMLRRAPDNKIYFTCLYETGWRYPDSVRNIYNENLSVINDPDSVGFACNFQPFSFYLGGKRTYWNLPNNANYSLRKINGSPCDSIHPRVNEITGKDFIDVYPNPSNGLMTLISSTLKNVQCKVYDILGIEISTVRMENGYARLDLSGKKNGLYFIKADGLLVGKIILMQ